MKQQVLTQKSRVLILSALLFIFIYGIHGMSYAGLEFTQQAELLHVKSQKIQQQADISEHR